MNAPSTQTIKRPSRPGIPDIRLHGHWLVIAGVTWFVVVGLAVALFIASIPTYFTFLHTLTTGVVVDLNGGQLTQQGVHDLHALGLSVDFYAIYHIVLNAIFMLGFLTVGGLLFWRKADDRMAMLTSFALVTSPFGIFFQLTTLPSDWAFTIHCMAFFSGISLGLFFYLFPSGRFVPSWTRWLITGWVIHEGITDFLPFPTFSLFSNVLFFALLVSLVAVQVYRYRRVSTPLQRQQTRWVVFGCTVAIVGFLGVIIPGTFSPSFFQPGTSAYFVGATAIPLFLLCIPLSIGIAILRYRLWDIDLIINRTLVYGGLSACVVGIYVLVVGYLSTLFRVTGNLFIALLATGLIAVLFQPLRERLQRAVNRLMYGERDTPYRVISRLGQRLEATLAPEAVLPTIVDTVAQALKLPYAAITLQQDGEFVIAASYGSAKDDLVRLPLNYQTEKVGELLLAQRASGEKFTSADRVLLNDLARQAGVAAHAVRLTTDLQRLTSELQHSRTQLVTVQEEERRRLRRDLHDGLGPTLGALTLSVGSARYLYTHDTAAADALMDKLERDIAATVTEIRRLVYALRPPVLDEYGLVAAIRECAVHYSASGETIGGEGHTTGLSVTIHAPDSLPMLPAAVEVAAYRIAQEALTNVARHARAQTCVVCLALSDVLHLEIADDGIGLPEGQRLGVGLLSMRERAMELGGICEVQRLPAGGTRVTARLPLPQEMRSTEHHVLLPKEPVNLE